MEIDLLSGSNLSNEPVSESFVREYTSSQPAATRYGEVSGAQDWKFWNDEQIWVKNSTGRAIHVLMHSLKFPLKDLVKLAVDADAGVGGAKAGVALDWVVRKRQAMVVADEELPANDNKFTPFHLGPEPDAAYVTAYIVGTNELCCSRVVPRRHSVAILVDKFAGTASELQWHLQTSSNSGEGPITRAGKRKCSIM